MNGPADFLEVPVSPVTGTVLRQRPLHQDGAHLRVHRRPDQERQAQARPVAQRPPARHLPRLLQPRAGDGALRGAALHPQGGVQPLPRDAGEHDPRADVLLRQRFRPRHRREHGDADARRPAARQRGAHVRDKHGVNMLACICAIDKATLLRRWSTTGCPGWRSRACTSWSATRWSWRARTSARPTCAATPLAGQGGR